MKQILFIVLFTAIKITFAQDLDSSGISQKHFIFFKTKEILAPLMKTNIENSLNEKSLIRRYRLLGKENAIDSYDIPVREQNVNKLKEIGVQIIYTLNWLNAVSCYLTQEQILLLSTFNFIEKIQKVKSIKYIEKEKIEETSVIGKFGVKSIEELNYGSSYQQLLLSDIPKIHNENITGKGVRIGLFDSGFDWRKHESLTNSRVIAEWDFVFNDSITYNEQNDIASQHNHGTYVFSIIGGFKPGSLIGSSFESEFILAKTEDTRSEKHIEEDNFVAALEWMEGLGVDIISSSLGYNEFDSGQGDYSYSDMNGNTTIITKATEIAFSKGILLLTSAGNEGNKSWKYITAPADGFNIIAVGSVNNQNTVSAFSSIGPTYDGRIKPEIVAQGENVFGAAASSISQYLYNSGTSAAAPIAAGVAGLLLSAHPYLTNMEMRDILLITSDNSGKPNNYKGYGLVSALKSIEYPVIKNENSINKCYKYFFSGVKDSVQMKYSFEGKNFLNAFNEVSSINNKFIFSFASQNSFGNVFYYYFEYRDSNDNKMRNPQNESEVYFFNSGKTKVVNLNAINRSEEFISNIYPNPFTPKHKSANFEIKTNRKSFSSIDIYNAIGEKIKTVYRGNLDEGIYHFSWNIRNDNNILLPNGIYFVQIQLDDKIETKKIIIIK